MQPTSKEQVTGFNKELYIIKVFDHKTHKDISVCWFNKATGCEESIDVLQNDITEHIEPILASIRKAIKTKK